MVVAVRIKTHFLDASEILSKKYLPFNHANPDGVGTLAGQLPETPFIFYDFLQKMEPVTSSFEDAFRLKRCLLQLNMFSTKSSCMLVSDALNNENDRYRSLCAD